MTAAAVLLLVAQVLPQHNNFKRQTRFSDYENSGGDVNIRFLQLLAVSACCTLVSSISIAADNGVTVTPIPIDHRWRQDVVVDKLTVTLLTQDANNAPLKQTIEINYKDTPGKFPKDNPVLTIDKALSTKAGDDNHIEWNGQIHDGNKTFNAAGSSDIVTVDLLWTRVDKKTKADVQVAVAIKHPSIQYNLGATVLVSTGKGKPASSVTVKPNTAVALTADLAVGVNAVLSADTKFTIYSDDGGKLTQVTTVKGAVSADKRHVTGSWTPLAVGTYRVHSSVVVGSVAAGTSSSTDYYFDSETIAVSTTPATIVVSGDPITLKAELVKFNPGYGKEVEVAVVQDGGDQDPKQFPEEAHLKIEVYQKGQLATTFSGEVEVTDNSGIYNGLFGATKLPITLQIQNGVLVNTSQVKDHNLTLLSVSPFKFKGKRVQIDCTIPGLTPVAVRVPQWVDNIQLTSNDPRGTLSATGNNIPDWIDFNVAYCEKIAKGEVKTCIGKIIHYGIGESKKDSLHSIMSIGKLTAAASQSIMINESSPTLRPKTNFTPMYHGVAYNPSKDPFYTAYIHEGRHAQIGYEDSLPRNDQDGDLLPANVSDVSTPSFTDPQNSQSTRTVVDKDDNSKLPVNLDPVTANPPADLAGTSGEIKATTGQSTHWQGDVTFTITDKRLEVLQVLDLELTVSGKTVRLPTEVKDHVSQPAPAFTTLKGVSGARFRFFSPSRGVFTYNLELDSSDGYKIDDFQNCRLKVEYKYPSVLDAATILELDAYTWTSQNQ